MLIKQELLGLKTINGANLEVSKIAAPLMATCGWLQK